MNYLSEAIKELNIYEKGETIPFPDDLITILPIENTLLKILGTNTPNVVISRRSLAHIVQKGWIGEMLASSIEECIREFDEVYLSDKGRGDSIRYLILKFKVVEYRDMAVVLEIDINKDYSAVITAMVADIEYISRKYKKLR